LPLFPERISKVKRNQFEGFLVCVARLRQTYAIHENGITS
jgi:hypothetical protein